MNAISTGTRQLSVCRQTIAAMFSTQTGNTLATTKDQVSKVAHELTQSEPQITVPGQAFSGDYRSTSALGTGDGLSNHTAKWWQPEMGGTQTSPLEYCQAAEPIKVDSMVVASTGSDDASLGCPVEYISLKGTSKENPAVCKYTGLKYYSDAWRH
ncbi:NADH dehydrogenase [ubiquinone] iron-sulfur protein 6 [Picochlorum sp. SENEW3]|nr:NADH dehydrogenase [ubiquinone] iron-sulfur protein 6 [Picochlorum sp. SENEW3]